MPKKIVTVTFTGVVEFDEVQQAYLIALSNDKVILIPRSEYVEVTVTDQPETTPENNP